MRWPWARGPTVALEPELKPVGLERADEALAGYVRELQELAFQGDGERLMVLKARAEGARVFLLILKGER